MKYLILFFFTLSSVFCIAQTRSYDIGVGYGKYIAPNFVQKVSKDYWLADFTFHVTNRWSVTSGFLAGKFNYYDTLRSNAWEEITKYTTPSTNARGYELHTFAVVNYDILMAGGKVFVQIGTGAGLLTQRLKYPYRQACSSGCAVFIGEESASNFEIPLKFRAYYLLHKRISIGASAGGFMSTKLKLTGIHVGPQIRLKL